MIKGHMIYYMVPLNKPLQYHMTGKFQAPSADWQHFHRRLTDYELIVVTQGTAYLQLEDRQYAVGEGAFLLCAPFQRQFGFKSSLCAFYWLHFNCAEPVQTVTTDAFPEAPTDNTVCIPLTGRAENPDKLIVLMKHLQDDARSYGNPLQNSYLCSSVLCELHCQFAESTRTAALTRRQKQIFYDIQDYVKWHSSTDLRVSAIAAHFGYNRRYLSALFHSAAGISLKAYITQQKLEEAKYLLCDTNNTVAEIAAKLGYKDCRTFLRAFKQDTGLTPSQYRNAYAKRLLFYR